MFQKGDKMRIISLGSKSGGMGPQIAKDRPSSHVSYPSFSVNDINLPLSPGDVGKTIKAVVTLKVNKAGAEIEEYGDKKKHFRSSFSVMDICIQGKGRAKVETMDKPTLDDLEKAEYEGMSLFGKNKKGRK